MGVLSGYRIVEFAGIGPAPMAAMLLSDMGAEVLRIDRVEESHLGILMEHRYNLLCRGRRSVAIDLKHREGREAALKLIAGSHGLIEGFRPGVMERLGLSPDDCLARNPRLVYGRVTGWGQDGPLAQAAGHDINYIALTGALHGIGERDGLPVPPLNLVGDFGGGGVYLALGLVAGMLEAQVSGKGQVIDAAMVDGAASQMTFVYGLRAAGQWTDGRAENTLDGGAPNYRAYETRDGQHIAIGPVEPKFWDRLLRRIGAAEEGETCTSWTTDRSGRECASACPRSFAPGPGRNGGAYWREATSALPRFSTWARPLGIPTTGRGRPSWRWRACRSRRRRRVSAALPAASSGLQPSPASTPGMP